MEVSKDLCCIDFGTSTSVASILVKGRPQLVNYGHDNCFPTVACVLPDGKIEVCNGANEVRSVYPEYFKQEFKLDIAQPLDLNGRHYVQIVAEILHFIKSCAEVKNNDRRIDSVVLTHPALYTDSDPRLKVMREAAVMAGFKDVEFMSEPVAAARHYAFILGEQLEGLTLIYDLGGGTFDPVLLECKDGGQPQIIGFDHGVSCGGQFFDRQIYKHISSHFKEMGHPLDKSRRLEDYRLCRQLKEELSFSMAASRIFSNAESFTLTRKQLETLLSPLVDLTVHSCTTMLRTAGREWKDVDRVLLVGGSSAIPLVSKSLASNAEIAGKQGLEIIRSTSGANGEYQYLYAVGLGGISPLPMSKEKDSKEKASDDKVKTDPAKEGSNTDKSGKENIKSQRKDTPPEYKPRTQNPKQSKEVKKWHCTKCNTDIRPIAEGNRFCSNCGAPKEFLQPVMF